MSGGHGIMTVKQTHEGIKSPPGRKGLKNTIRGDPMQFEDDYTRRRAYISRRQKQRKRQRMVRILIFFMILGIWLPPEQESGFLRQKASPEPAPILLPTTRLHPAPQSPAQTRETVRTEKQGPVLRKQNPPAWTNSFPEPRAWPPPTTMTEPSPC